MAPKEPRGGEIELKLAVVPGAADALRRRARAILGEPSGPPDELVSTYYDTRKAALQRRGLSLRVRERGGERVQTLKNGGGAGAGLFARREWESAAGPDGPEPGRFADPEAADLLDRHGKLRPAFRVSVSRTTWDAREGASRIEVALDEGSAAAGAVAAPLAELELELKEGEPADLFRLARRLAEGGRLRLSARSKAEHGYALLDGSWQDVVKAPPVPLRRSMSAGEAFQAIARTCLRHFRLNEDGVVLDRRPDALHQARVAIRRLRSALSLFKDVVADDERDGIKAELRSLSRLLGRARNLDVFIAGPLADERKKRPDEAGLAELEARTRADRERAYDRAIRRLASRRFRLFLLDLSAWIETGPWRDAPANVAARDGPAWRFAQDALDRRRRKVSKRGRRLAEASPEERHRVRIEAKTLRYASEFFAGLVKGGKARKRHRAFVAALSDFQDSLGELNDIRTGQDLARALVDGRDEEGREEGSGEPGEALLAMGHIAGEGTDREERLLAAALAARAEFADADPFWR